MLTNLLYSAVKSHRKFQDITMIGSSLFFLASRLGDSLLVQFTCGLGSSMPSALKEEVADWLISMS